MTAIVKIGLRHVGTTRYFTNNNSKKYLQSICHVRNDFSHITKYSNSARTESSGFWKISDRTKKTLWYSTIPLNAIVIGYCTHKIMTDPKIWTSSDIIEEPDTETLKYSMNLTKSLTSSVLFNDLEITVKTRKDNIIFTDNNKRGSVINEDRVQEPRLYSELKVKSKNGDTIFTFYHTVRLKVQKASETPQNKSPANKKEQPEIMPLKIGKFNLLTPGITKMTLKTPESEKKWTTTHPNYQPDPHDGFSTIQPLFFELYPISGKFSLLSHTTSKIQEDKSDEVFYFEHIVNFKCDKKLNKKEFPILVRDMESCDVIMDSGTVVFKTQDGYKFVVRKRLNIKVFEDGGYTYLEMSPEFSYGSFVSIFHRVQSYLSAKISKLRYD